jgi:hypothetical protein
VPFWVWWILFGAPLTAAAISWLGLCRHWNVERHRLPKLLAVLLATAATLLACGSLAYVQFVGPISARDYRVEGWGLLISFSGVISGLVNARFPRWFSGLALLVSTWMFVLFVLMASTY